MASTTNLGLTVDQAGTTKFWNRNAQETTHIKTVDDNFRLIDAFAGQIESTIGDINTILESLL